MERKSLISRLVPGRLSQGPILPPCMNSEMEDPIPEFSSLDYLKPGTCMKSDFHFGRPEGSED
jgi:hypothetical protein